MTNITESDIIVNMTLLKNPNENNVWFDRVYLCYENVNGKQPNSVSIISGFNCYKYKTFMSADENHIKNIHAITNINDIRHTMIPVCKWVPEIFDKYILNWKLKNMYWGGKINIGFSSSQITRINSYGIHKK